MSRQERKLAKVQSKEEKRLKNKQAWDQAPKGVKIVAYIILGLIGLMIIIGIFGGDDSKEQQTKSDLVDKVNVALNNLGEDMKSELASTSPDGYRGDIVSVEPAIGDGTVKVNVSTYFKDSGSGIDGGQGIARRILSNICLDVPELDSVYVVSSSGLESESAYRSQLPGCNQ